MSGIAHAGEELAGAIGVVDLRRRYRAAVHQRESECAVPSLEGLNVPIEADGTLGIVDGISGPGKRVAFRAEMDILVLVSNCPQMNNPCNDFNPTPLRMIITAAEGRSRA